MNRAILTICNDAFVTPCSVMIYSFLKHNKWYDGDIIICCDTKEFTLNAENREALSSLYDKVQFREVNRDEYIKFIDNFRKARKNNRFLPSAYTYEVFDLKEYDLVLYLDADMLIVDSIEDIFKYDCPIGVVALTSEHYKKWEINALGKYNLGLLLVNYYKYPKTDFRKIKFDLISKGESVTATSYSLFEQSIFNKFLPDGVESLPTIYNYFDKFTTPDEKKIIHYVSHKPWEMPTANKNTLLWNTYKQELKG